MANNPVSKRSTPSRAPKTSAQPVSAAAPAAAPVAANPPQNNGSKSNRSGLHRVLTATTAVIVIGAMAFWFARPRPGGISAQARSETEPAEQVAVAPEPQTNLEAPVAAPATPAPQTAAAPAFEIPLPQFDSVKVQCIFYSATNSTVVINGRSLRVGQKIKGLEVIAITQTNTTLGFGKERRVFEMN